MTVYCAYLLQVDFSSDDLQDSAFSFLKEAKIAVGTDLAALMEQNGIELQYVGEST
jgi:hypothetical protein